MRANQRNAVGCSKADAVPGIPSLFHRKVMDKNHNKRSGTSRNASAIWKAASDVAHWKQGCWWVVPQVEALLLTLEAASNNLELASAPATASTCFNEYGFVWKSYTPPKNWWFIIIFTIHIAILVCKITHCQTHLDCNHFLVLNSRELSGKTQVLHLVPDTLRESISHPQFVQLPGALSVLEMWIDFYFLIT